MPTAGRGIVVNGRFLTQRTSGVQRYARELLNALAALPRNAARPVEATRLAVPSSVKRQASDPAWLSAYELHAVGRLSGHAWEQLELAGRLGDRLLVNLCNTAPLSRENQLVVIHDVAVWRHPEAFSRRFRLLYRILLPQIARKSRKLLTISAFSARELMSCLNVPGRSIEILPNAGDHILRATPEPSILQEHNLEAHRYVLAVGNANPMKNYAFLRCLEPLLSETRLPLVLAGGALPSVFAPDAAAAGPWIRRVGYVSDDALRALYENAMGFIFPSLYEGAGVPPLEAMHCGCPVLAAHSAAIPETCGEAAAYFDPRDPQSLINLCRRFIASPALRAELSAAGLAHTRRFSWSQSAQILQQIIERSGMVEI
jgi:glycosyltransferase involved in cell wall biosynthesis